MNAHPGAAYAPLITILVIAVVLFLRMRRLTRGRRLRLEWLWVTPVIVIAGAGVAIAAGPPAGLAWLWMVFALAVGAALGWQRGRMMTITVDPETHALNTQATPAAIVFILLLVAARVGMRSLAVQEAGTLNLDIRVITDVFAVFAVGLLSVQRVEMWLRAQRLLAEARAAKAAA